MVGGWNLCFFWLLLVVPPIILIGTVNAGTVEKGNDGPQFRLLRRELAPDETAEPSSSIITVNNVTEHGEPGSPAAIIGINDNIAAGKPANQSSTDENRDASKATNGIDEGIMDYTLTLNTTQPKWWMVDLGRQYQILRVLIKNRHYSYLWPTLNRITLLMADNRRPIPSLDPPAGGWRNMSYIGMWDVINSELLYFDRFDDGRPRYVTARYIAIYSEINGVLSLSEVRVYGQDIVNCSMPPDIDNADWTEQGRGFDATASYTCRQGYRMLGDANIECQQDSGVWMTPPVCELCQCRGPGAASATCNVGTATCQCNVGYEGTECDTCLIRVTGTSCERCNADYFGYPNCSMCHCSNIGANSMTCDSDSGQCDCKSGFTSDKCDNCADGQQSYPNCFTTTVPTTSPTTSPNISAYVGSTPKPRDLSLTVIVMSGAFWLVNLLRCSADFIIWKGQ